MKTIGRVDIVDFPDLEIFSMPVKIDTGAYTSTIHCHQIKLNKEVLNCTFDCNGQKINKQFNQFKLKKVKSSNGTWQERFEVKTTIKLFNKKYKININLSKRPNMRYPVLLGRKFLKNKFIVDVRLNNVSYTIKN